MSDMKSEEHEKFWCKRCLLYFYEKERLDMHVLFCRHADFTDIIYDMVR